MTLAAEESDAIPVRDPIRARPSRQGHVAKASEVSARRRPAARKKSHAAPAPVGMTFSQTLDRIAKMTRARDAVRLAVTGLRKTLLAGPQPWLAAAGVKGDLADVDIGLIDRSLLMRIRGAINRALPQPAEIDLRTNLYIFFGQAFARGLVPANPMNNQPPVVGQHSKLHLSRQRRERRLDMPDEGQVSILLSDCDDWVALADWLTIEASTRPPEARAVIWTDIKLHPRKQGNETGGNLTIERQMGSGKGDKRRGVTPRRTKTDPGQRIVEFGPTLAAHLRRLMPPPAQRHRHVVSPDGNPVDAMELLRARKLRQLRLGIAKVVGQAHGKDLLGNFFNGIKLRHAFAARRISQGTPHTTLARQMGHKNYRITLNIYGYLFERVAAHRAAQKG